MNNGHPLGPKVRYPVVVKILGAERFFAFDKVAEILVGDGSALGHPLFGTIDPPLSERANAITVTAEKAISDCIGLGQFQ